jgi:exonuclease SbcC
VQLRTLRLENFRQHARTEILFEEGMTAIVGGNGAGKSTVVEAITYALYGEQRDKKETIRFHWSEKKKFSVSLSFDLGDKTFQVERTNAEASLRELTDEGKTWATGLSEVTRACERLLQSTYEQFVNSYCAEQKGLAFLQFRSNTARQEEVARMLGYDRLKRAEELAGQRRRELGVRREVLERNLPDPDVLKAELKAAENREREAVKEQSDASSRLEKLQASAEPARERRERAERFLILTGEMAQIRGQAEGLKTAVTLTKADLDAAERDFNEHSSLGPVEREYHEVEARLKELREQREADLRRSACLDEVGRLEADRQRLQEELQQHPAPDIAAMDASMKEAAQRVKAIQAERDRAQESWRQARVGAQREAAAAEARAEQAQKALTRAEALVARGVCPECERPFEGGSSPVLDNRRSEVEALRAEAQAVVNLARELDKAPLEIAEKDLVLADATTAHDDARRTREAATVEAERSRSLQEQLAKVSRRLEEIRAELQQDAPTFDASELATLESRRTELAASHQRFLALHGADVRLTARREAHQKADAELNEAKGRYRTLEEERGKLGLTDASDASAAVADFQRLQSELTSAQAALASAAEMERMASQTLARAQQRQAEYAEQLEELRQVRFDEGLHEAAAREMRALRLELNRTVGPDLAARGSENLSLLTNGRYLMMELDKNFAPALIEDGVTKTVISGGEEDVVALSLRLALSELIQERQGHPMSLLILDEVFGSLDVERRHSVLERLAALKGRFAQILVISHIEEINQVADQCLYLRRDPATRMTIVTDAPPEFASLT